MEDGLNLSELWQGVQSYAVIDAVLLPIAVLCMWLLSRHGLQPLLDAAQLAPRARALRMLRHFGEGLLAALFLLLVSVLPPWLLGAYSPSAASWKAFEPDITVVDNSVRIATKLLFLLQSLFEELLFRGVGMALLALLLLWVSRFVVDTARYPRTITFAAGLAANLVVSLAFAFVHVGNPEATAIGVMNVALAGYFIGMLFWQQRSILGAWSAHFLWNFGIVALGLPVSGIALSAPQYGTGASGAVPGLLSGGLFGPEGSLHCTIGLLGLSFWYTARALKQSVADSQRAPQKGQEQTDEF